MFKIEDKHITLTRGDSFTCKVDIYDSSGAVYTPANDDVIRFAMKHTVNDRKPVITKVIPNSTLLLSLSPEDTKKLEFGDYIYDIQITLANGSIDTFIPEGKFTLAVEVD